MSREANDQSIIFFHAVKCLLIAAGIAVALVCFFEIDTKLMRIFSVLQVVFVIQSWMRARKFLTDELFELLGLLAVFVSKLLFFA